MGDAPVVVANATGAYEVPSPISRVWLPLPPEMPTVFLSLPLTQPVPWAAPLIDAPDPIVSVLPPVASLPEVNVIPPPSLLFPIVRLLPSVTPFALLTPKLWRLLEENFPAASVTVCGPD